MPIFFVIICKKNLTSVHYLYFHEIFLQFSNVQVKLCQKHLFWHQLTHNMTQNCSLNYKFSRYKFQGQNMMCTKIDFFCVRFVSQNNLRTKHVLNLEFSCNELVIQWTIFCHGLVNARIRNLKKKFTCTYANSIKNLVKHTSSWKQEGS